MCYEKLHEIQISVSINKAFLECSQPLSGCFCATTATTAGSIGELLQSLLFRAWSICQQALLLTPDSYYLGLVSLLFEAVLLSLFCRDREYVKPRSKDPDPKGKGSTGTSFLWLWLSCWGHPGHSREWGDWRAASRGEGIGQGVVGAHGGVLWGRRAGLAWPAMEGKQAQVRRLRGDWQ